MSNQAGPTGDFTVYERGHLGWAIREARLAQGLSQHRLATRAGVSRAWLAHVETGHRTAEFKLLMRTLEALGLSFSIGPTPTAGASDPELDKALRIAGQQ